MTEIIKQRLVGMLIVVIAGVVFLPDLLDGEKQLSKEEFRKVPAKPEIDEQPILTDFPRQQVETALAEAPRFNGEVSDSDAAESAEVQELPQAPVMVEANTDETAKEVSNTEQGEQSEQTTEVASTTKRNSGKRADFVEPAWILQLGSFKHKENVDALRKTLLDAGFQTFIKPVQTKSGVLSKVYLGPELKKETLVDAQATLKELVGLEGKITRYDPIK